jgi:hypothetical protein
MMKNDKTAYIKTTPATDRVIRAEIWSAPFLIVIPILFSLLLISDWFYRGFSTGSHIYDGELFIGIIIFVGNIIFDIPFLRSLLSSRKI